MILLNLSSIKKQVYKQFTNDQYVLSQKVNKFPITSINLSYSVTKTHSVNDEYTNTVKQNNS